MSLSRVDAFVSETSIAIGLFNRPLTATVVRNLFHGWICGLRNDLFARDVYTDVLDLTALAVLYPDTVLVSAGQFDSGIPDDRVVSSPQRHGAVAPAEIAGCSGEDHVFQDDWGFVRLSGEQRTDAVYVRPGAEISKRCSPLVVLDSHAVGGSRRRSVDDVCVLDEDVLAVVALDAADIFVYFAVRGSLALSMSTTTVQFFAHDSFVGWPPDCPPEIRMLVLSLFSK